MKTSKTYGVCDCGKEVRTHDDGIILQGAIFPGGPVSSSGEPEGNAVLWGLPEHTRGGGPAVIITAVYWGCFDKKMDPSSARELRRKIREAQDMYDRLNPRTDW